MLVTAKELLDRAAAEGYAVIITRMNYSAESIGAIQAAEELNAPLILEIRPDPVGTVPHQQVFLAWIGRLCEEAKVKIALSSELERGTAEELDVVQGGVSLTCLYENPRLPEISAEALKLMNEESHKRGVYFATKIGNGERPAEPEKAVQLIQEIGLDCLTVEVNTKTEAGKTVDIARLKDIRAAADRAAGKSYPLILHGLQGMEPEVLRQACQSGASALNISKDIWWYVRDRIIGEIWDPFAVSIKSVREKVSELIELSGSAGKS